METKDSLHRSPQWAPMSGKRGGWVDLYCLYNQQITTSSRLLCSESLSHFAGAE